MQDKKILHEGYEAVREACLQSYTSEKTRVVIKQLCMYAVEFLSEHAELVPLNSRVAGKQYISYRTDGAVARPANAALFVKDLEEFKTLWVSWDEGVIAPPDLLKLLYTAALAPCLGMELFDKQNKKGPATFFECLVGNLIATNVKREPSKKAPLKIGNSLVRMTMDFLFSPEDGQPGIHVPVKMSTRERVVQAWAHHRILDSAYGAGNYKGLMILFSETKLDSRNLEVVEICVPDQWLAYQTHLGTMDNIYYFDMPDRYLQMAAKFPDLMRVETIEKYFT